MSNITENTIIIESKYEKVFEKEYIELTNEYWLSELNKIYSNDKVSIYIFDCNGDNPWYSRMDEFCSFLYNEINYLDGEPPLTTMINEDGLYVETDTPICKILKHIVNAGDVRRVKKDISYSS